jgi:hypothetical protein
MEASQCKFPPPENWPTFFPFFEKPPPLRVRMLQEIGIELRIVGLVLNKYQTCGAIDDPQDPEMHNNAQQNVPLNPPLFAAICQMPIFTRWLGRVNLVRLE